VSDRRFARFGLSCRCFGEELWTSPMPTPPLPFSDGPVFSEPLRIASLSPAAIISSAMVAAIGNGAVFSKGRDFGAWQGPRFLHTELPRKRSRLHAHGSQKSRRLANVPACLIGMEACVGAHHLSRKLQSHGHDARLMPAKYVRPYCAEDRIGAPHQNDNAWLRSWPSASQRCQLM
jgi:hypothetical protein